MDFFPNGTSIGTSDIEFLTVSVLAWFLDDVADLIDDDSLVVGYDVKSQLLAFLIEDAVSVWKVDYYLRDIAEMARYRLGCTHITLCSGCGDTKRYATDVILLDDRTMPTATAPDTNQQVLTPTVPAVSNTSQKLPFTYNPTDQGTMRLSDFINGINDLAQNVGQGVMDMSIPESWGMYLADAIAVQQRQSALSRFTDGIAEPAPITSPPRSAHPAQPKAQPKAKKAKSRRAAPRKKNVASVSDAASGSELDWRFPRSFSPSRDYGVNLQRALPSYSSDPAGFAPYLNAIANGQADPRWFKRLINATFPGKSAEHKTTYYQKRLLA